MEYFEKNVTFIASISPKLLLPKNVVTWMPENSSFGTEIPNQWAKLSKTLLTFPRQHFYANVPLISSKLSCVWCLLVRCQILRPLFNTLMVAQMHFCHNWQKFPQQVQTQLSSKPWTFSSNFIAFSKFR